jgi:hypothetical protein
MRASDLATALPTSRTDTPALESARLLAGRNLPGLSVLDDAGGPVTVLPGCRWLEPEATVNDALLDRVLAQ